MVCAGVEEGVAVCSVAQLSTGHRPGKGNYIAKEDVRVVKNYLSERELQVLNLLVSQFLDFAELQALEEHPMTMANWVSEMTGSLPPTGVNCLKEKEAFRINRRLRKRKRNLRFTARGK